MVKCCDNCCCVTTDSDNQNTLSPSDCAVVIDVNVKGGTANVLDQKQFIRALYSGDALQVEQITLKPEQSSSDTKAYSFMCVMTNKPVSLTYIDSANLIITVKVNKILILDNYIGSPVIINHGTEDAIVSVTRLK